MNKELNLFGTIVSGKLEINNRQAYDQWIKNCPDGADIVIKFRNQENFYSVRQLRLIHAEFREIARTLGESVEYVKKLLKMEFGYYYCENINGKEICECKSLSYFDKKELSSFIQEIDIWASQKLSLKLLNFDDIQFLKEEK